MRQDHGLGRARYAVIGAEVTSQSGDNTQGVKKSIAHLSAGGRFGAGGGAYQKTAGGNDIERSEDGVELLPIEVIQIGKVGARNHRSAFGCFYQAAGIGVGKRFDQRGVGKREHGYAGAHSQGQHTDGGAGESEILAQLAQSKTEILEHRFEAEFHNFAATFFQSGGVAKLPAGGAMRGFRGHPGGAQIFLYQFAMEGHFFIHLVAEILAAKQERQFLKEAKE